MTIGQVIKKYRMKMGLSQREFATKCGISNFTISMYEKNGLNPPKRKVAGSNPAGIIAGNPLKSKGSRLFCTSEIAQNSVK